MSFEFLFEWGKVLVWSMVATVLDVRTSDWDLTELCLTLLHDSSLCCRWPETQYCCVMCHKMWCCRSDMLDNNDVGSATSALLAWTRSCTWLATSAITSMQAWHVLVGLRCCVPAGTADYWNVTTTVPCICTWLEGAGSHLKYCVPAGTHHADSHLFSLLLVLYMYTQQQYAHCLLGHLLHIALAARPAAYGGQFHIIYQNHQKLSNITNASSHKWALTWQTEQC